MESSGQPMQQPGQPKMLALISKHPLYVLIAIVILVILIVFLFFRPGKSGAVSGPGFGVSNWQIGSHDGSHIRLEDTKYNHDDNYRNYSMNGAPVGYPMMGSVQMPVPSVQYLPRHRHSLPPMDAGEIDDVYNRGRLGMYEASEAGAFDAPCTPGFDAIACSEQKMLQALGDTEVY